MSQRPPERVSQRLPVRVKVISRTGAKATFTKTTLTLHPNGQLVTNEIITILHTMPEHRRVTEVIIVPDFMEGGWSVLNARTNEKCGHVKPEN